MQEVVQPICLALKSFQPLLVPKLGYSQLAVMAYGEKRKLFKLRPKVHMYHEIFEYLDCDSPISLSPMTAATWSDEDFIGRVSRVARSGHGACCFHHMHQKVPWPLSTPLPKHQTKMQTRCPLKKAAFSRFMTRMSCMRQNVGKLHQTP